MIPFFDYYKNHNVVIKTIGPYRLSMTAQDLIYMFRSVPNCIGGTHFMSLGLPLTVGLVLLFYVLSDRSCIRDIGEGVRSMQVLSGMAFLNLAFVSSYFPWDLIQGIHENLSHKIGTLQFAWRFYGPASVLLTFAVVFAMNRIQEKKRYFGHVCMLLTACIIFSAGFFYHILLNDFEKESFNVRQPYEFSDNLYLFSGNDQALCSVSVPQLIRGEAVWRDCENENGVLWMNLKNTGKDEAVISAPVFAYKYFRAYDENGGRIEIVTGEDSRLALVIAPDFSGWIQVKFEEPFFWRISEMVSLIFLLITAGMLWREKKKLKIQE